MRLIQPNPSARSPSRSLSLSSSPPVPHPPPSSSSLLQVVCPDIKSDGLKWTLLGEVQARQCMLYRGVLPIMADPDFSLPGGAILDYAIAYVRGIDGQIDGWVGGRRRMERVVGGRTQIGT